MDPLIGYEALQMKWLMRIIVWTFSKWLLKQVNQERNLLIGSCRFFWCFQMDVKDIKCLLDCWKKHEMMFLTIVFLTIVIPIVSKETLLSNRKWGFWLMIIDLNLYHSKCLEVQFVTCKGNLSCDPVVVGKIIKS